MRKLLFLIVGGILFASSTAMAQCSSCAGSAPSFQSVPYASAPMYGSAYQTQTAYGLPMSYSSAPAYVQPVYGQPIYSQPTYSGMVCPCNCCGQSYQAPMVYSAPVYYGNYSAPSNCGSCGSGAVYYGDPVINAAAPTIAAPEAVAPAAIPSPPPVPAENVTPPAPNENKGEAHGDKPAPEEKKEGET